MRLFADENIPPPTILFLRELGYDVRGVDDDELVSVSDDVIFGHVQQQGRTLLTYNADFVDLRELVGKDHHGIIRLRLSSQRVADLNSVLQGALERLEGMDLKNMLVTVSSEQTRMRNTFSF